MPELIVAEALRAVLEAGRHLPVVQARPAEHHVRKFLAHRVVDRALPGWELFLDLKLVSPSFSVREAVNRYIDAGLAAVSTYTNVATP